MVVWYTCLLLYGYQGSEEDSEKLSLTSELFSAVLAIVGDFNADLGVIPCLAKGKPAGRCVGLALAFSLAAEREPVAACRFKLDGCAGFRRDSAVACPNASAASTASQVTDWWVFAPLIYSC